MESHAGRHGTQSWTWYLQRPKLSPAYYAPCRTYEPAWNTHLLDRETSQLSSLGDAYRKGGVPIFPVIWNDVKTQYCCGTVELSSDKTTCRYGDPFSIAGETVLPGIAYLSNATYRFDRECDYL